MKIVDQAANAISFLEDILHESHFDKLMWMIRTRRDDTARQVPEWEQLRDLASQIKEHTLSRLGDYLEQLESSATKRGVHVHWARDAHEHNEIVYGILADHNDIIVLLDPKVIVPDIHAAYQHPHFRNKAYAVLMTGPSGSADIGGKTVHPAQGVMTLTVIYWPRNNHAGEEATK